MEVVGMMPHLVSAIASVMSRKATRTELERSRLEDMAVLGAIGGVSILASCVAPALNYQRFHATQKDD